MTHVTCRLTAKNRDQLRNPTLGNRVWATFLLNVHQLQARACMPLIASQKCLRDYDNSVTDWLHFIQKSADASCAVAVHFKGV